MLPITEIFTNLQKGVNYFIGSDMIKALLHLALIITSYICAYAAQDGAYPIEGVRVILRERLSGEIIAQATTNTYGQFEFREIAIGEYSISIVINNNEYILGDSTKSDEHISVEEPAASAGGEGEKPDSVIKSWGPKISEDSGVPEKHHARLTLAVEIDGSRISGRVSCSEGACKTFDFEKTGDIIKKDD